jgi:hypothetical protein
MSPKTFSNVRRLILACACLWGCSGEIGSPGGVTAEHPGGGGGGNTGAGGGGIGSTTTPTDPGRGKPFQLITGLRSGCQI